MIEGMTHSTENIMMPDPIDIPSEYKVQKKKCIKKRPSRSFTATLKHIRKQTHTKKEAVN